MWGLIYMSYVFIFMVFFLGFFVGIYCIYIYRFFNHGMVLFYGSNFFVSRHLENSIIFIHGLPILLRFFFFGYFI